MWQKERRSRREEWWWTVWFTCSGRILLNGVLMVHLTPVYPRAGAARTCGVRVMAVAQEWGSRR